MTVRPQTHKTLSRITAAVLTAVFVMVFLGCVRSQGRVHMEMAIEKEEARQFPDAILQYEKVFQTSANKEEVLTAAQRIYELSYLQTKDYRKAIYYLEYYVANATSFTDTLEALKKKAYIEHKILSLYEKAIQTYHRLLNSAKLDTREEQSFRLEVARCQYAINNYEQAQQEVTALLKMDLSDELLLAARLLQSTIYQSQGNSKKALEIMDTAAQVPSLSDEQKKDIALNRAILLEHQEKYADALSALEALKEPGPAVENKKEQLRRLVKFQRSRKR